MMTFRQRLSIVLATCLLTAAPLVAGPTTELP